MKSFLIRFYKNEDGFLGSIIGAVSNIIGANKQADAIGDAADLNAATQKEFAQKGISWRVEDAKSAGLHPLAALGAQILPFTPSYVGDTSVGSSLAESGQHLGRAIDQALDKGGRSYVEKTKALTLEKMALENKLLESQITRISQSNTPPRPPTGTDFSIIAGQGNSPLIQPQPLDRYHTDPVNVSKEVGSVPDYTYANTARGGLAIVPGADVKERIEDAFIPETMHSLRNTFIFDTPPYPDSRVNPPPRGHRWKWNRLLQEWRPTRWKNYN